MKNSMSKKITIILASMILLCVACQSTESTLQVETQTMENVSTDITAHLMRSGRPHTIDTPQPSHTPTVTPSPSKTPTSTSTLTPTRTLTPTPLPPHAFLEPMNHQWQTLNNCHHASIAILLGYYDIWFTQHDFLEGMDDINNLISPYGLTSRIYLVAYAVVPSSDAIRWLLAEGIPVIVGQKVSTSDSTWHYRVIRGYDDGNEEFFVDDSLLGPNHRISYQDFNKLSRGDGQIIPVYPLEKDEMIAETMKAWQMKLFEYP